MEFLLIGKWRDTISETRTDPAPGRPYGGRACQHGLLVFKEFVQLLLFIGLYGDFRIQIIQRLMHQANQFLMGLFKGVVWIQ